MRNTELFDDLSVGSSDGYPVLTAIHVDAGQKPLLHDGVLLDRATVARTGAIPVDATGRQKRTGAAI
ncbi:MAG: hypothetical protein NTV33_10435 [Coprothermobacterota bacterium]|nr:hypothetical protein [Coprothermobacterota bacterium]